MLRDDGLAEMEIDQSCGRQLGVVFREGGLKGPLVVVISVFGGVIFSAHIHNGMAIS